MQAHGSAPTAALPEAATESLLPPTAGVRVVDGYGVKIRVRHGQLHVEDGLGWHRRSDSYSRATCPFRRLLILGHTGYVSLEAVRWCWDLGIGVIQLDADRNVLLTSARREATTSRLRRVQALAPFTEVGVELARLVMDAKIVGQAEVVRSLPGGDRAAIVMGEALAAARGATTVNQVMVAESTAALAYWECWAGVSVRFHGRDEQIAPDHWRSFGTRTSLVSGTRRHASNPGNALLSYTYRLLEAETTLALHASGLDPALGVWHADEAGRDSFALDLMEAARPVVDRFVLDLLHESTFRKRDFHETPNATCRILPPLTHRLAEAMPAFAAAIEPTVLAVGRVLDRTLSHADAGVIRFGKPRRMEHRRAGRAKPSALPRIASCRDCGELLPAGVTDRYCRSCLPELSSDAGIAVAAARRRVSQARRDVMRRRAQAVAEWDRTHLTRPAPAEFTETILPQIQRVSQSALTRATGLSRRYCKLIQAGELVPHPMHWQAFRAVGNREPAPRS